MTTVGCTTTFQKNPDQLETKAKENFDDFMHLNFGQKLIDPDPGLT